MRMHLQIVKTHANIRITSRYLYPIQANLLGYRDEGVSVPICCSRVQGADSCQKVFSYLHLAFLSFYYQFFYLMIALSS